MVFPAIIAKLYFFLMQILAYMDIFHIFYAKTDLYLAKKSLMRYNINYLFYFFGGKI